MSKIDDLIAAAAELNLIELKELRMEIQRLEQRRPEHRFDVKGLSIGLTRLDDGAYLRLNHRSIAIEDDDMFLLNLLYPSVYWWREKQQPDWLNLAQACFVLEKLYGTSSLLYDNYESSFSFPFVLDVIKGDRVFPYLLRVQDYRGWIEFRLRKCVDSHADVDAKIHSPFESEFTREEIRTFTAYFCGRLQGRFKALLLSDIRPTPFVHRVESCCGLYGYNDSQFFEKHYDRREEFEAAYRALAAKMQIS